MSVLRPGETSALRAALNRHHQATAEVIRRQQVSDGQGGYVDSYVTVATYPCSYTPYPITPLERESAIAVQAIAFWRFVFPAGSDIRPIDRLIADGRTFEVVKAGAGSLEIQRTALCQEID